MPDIQSFYEDALDVISNQLICYREHLETFHRILAQKYAGALPGFFVISEPPFGPLEHGILCGKVETVDDAVAAIDAGARLMIARGNVGQVVHAVSARSQYIPVLAEVDSVTRAPDILSQTSIDGFVCHEFPSSDELSKLLTTIVRRQSDDPSEGKCTVGVLSHQGDFKLHVQHLQTARQELNADNVQVKEVRTANEIAGLDGLLLPGGWSNLQSWMMEIDGVTDLIRSRANEGMPICAVCAGMILARTHDGAACSGRIALGLIPMTIQNNVLDGSFDVVRLDSCGNELVETHGFSNGPYADALPDDVERLAWIKNGQFAGNVVGLRFKNVSAFAFHEGIHEGFLAECVEWASSR